MTVFIFARTQSVPKKFDSVVLITSIGCKSAPIQTVGTVIGDGLVLTVAHGVAGQTSTSITTISGQVLSARIVAIDVNLDLAVLYFDPKELTLDLAPLKFGDATAGINAYFVAYQNSLQVVRPAKIKRRLLINTQDIYLKADVSRPGIEVETSVVVGNSGGPIINDNGEIVGVVWSTSRAVENRSWATRVQATNELLLRISEGNPQSATPKVVACSR